MKTALTVIAVLAALASSPPLGHAQNVQRVFIAELHFARDSSGTPTLELKKDMVYVAEVVGRGMPVLKVVGSGRNAFVVPIADGEQPPRFQIYPFQTGLYSVSLEDQDSTETATLRLYRDVTQTRRVREVKETGGIVGFVFAAGVHSGLGLDSVAGPAPRGGSNYEACLLMQSSDRFATCLGGARQYMPDQDYVAGWLFIEERARLVTVRPFGNHDTDLGVALRLSKSMGVDDRAIYPGMLSFGVHVQQHLGARHRRGLSFVASWEHGSLKGTHTSQDPVTDQLVAGLIWVP